MNYNYNNFMATKRRFMSPQRNSSTGVVTLIPTMASRLFEKNHSKDFTFSGIADLKALFGLA